MIFDDITIAYKNKKVDGSIVFLGAFFTLIILAEMFVKLEYATIRNNDSVDLIIFLMFTICVFLGSRYVITSQRQRTKIVLLTHKVNIMSSAYHNISNTNPRLAEYMHTSEDVNISLFNTLLAECEKKINVLSLAELEQLTIKKLFPTVNTALVELESDVKQLEQLWGKLGRVSTYYNNNRFFTEK